MSRATTKHRIIKASTIQIGDLIRVSGRLQDADVSIVGKVAKRVQGGTSTYYETASAVELLAVHRDGTSTRGESHVTRISLINRNPDPTLF